MTFNDDSDIRGGRVSRRRGAAIGGGIGGGGLLLVIGVFVISQLTGVDLSGLVGPNGLTGGGEPVDDQPLTSECQTGADANETLDCRIQGAATSLDDFWSGEVEGYRQPEVILFTGSVSTECGDATSAVGPFYCPPDEKAYIDTAFYDDLRSRFGSSGGPLAELYVVAHEWGHHIQNITGRNEGLDRSDTGPESDSVRLELQADCYAGAWVGAATETTDDQGRALLEPISEQQLADALSAASAVGDDRIQSSAGGGVNPEAWTHGSSEQRQRWFTAGYERGTSACDTFAATTL